jgi:hypothetical protein
MSTFEQPITAMSWAARAPYENRRCRSTRTLRFMGHIGGRCAHSAQECIIFLPDVSREELEWTISSHIVSRFGQWKNANAQRLHPSRYRRILNR